MLEKNSMRSIIFKLRLCPLLFLLATLLLPCASIADTKQSQSLRVITDDNYPPYLFRNDDGAVEGYLVDYWKLWETKTGVAVTLIATDWDSAQKKVLAGDADVIDMIFKTHPREPLYDFSPAYADLPVGIFSHRSIAGITEISSLKGFQIGVQAGDACIDELARHGITSLVQYPNYARLIAAARLQDVKIFCLDEHPASFYLYKLKAENEFLKAFTLYTGKFHRAVPKGHQETLKLVEGGMMSITEAEQKRLQDKWFGTPVLRGPFAHYLWEILLTIIAAGAILVIWNLTLRQRVAARTKDLRRALTDLQLVTAAEADSKARLAATLQAIPDLLFEHERTGRYLDVFASRHNLLYRTKHDLIGKSIHDVLPADAAGVVQQAIEAALTLGHDYGRVIELDIDGRTCWFELSVTRKGTGQGATVLMLSRDITTRKEAERDLQQAREANRQAERDKLFKMLFNTVPVAISYASGDRLIFTNRQFDLLFGYEPGEITSVSDWWARAYPDPQYSQQVQATWSELTAQAQQGNGQVEAREYRVAGKDGREYDLLIGGQFIKGGLIVTFTDISPLKQVEAELRLAKDAAQAANVSKSAFLANMSHEIRTPLNAITGMAHILRRSGLTPEQTDKLDNIENASSHLLRIISDVLDLSKIEAGRFVLEEAPVNVDALLGNVASMLGQKARDKGLRFNIETTSLPHSLRGDPTRLQQALLNYVANAIKFTEHGHVTLRVTQIGETDETVILRFEVEDTGIGISPEAMNRLFNAFEQADNSTTRQYGGTGLGLAITKKIAEVMGGTAGATSAPGQGSIFWFSAILNKTHEAATQSVRTNIEGAEQAIQREFAGKRVLLAEDDPINRDIAQMLLEEVGLRVDLAENGQEAVEKASSGGYAIILIDMQMPVLDGLEATQQIRQLPGHKATPILAMTANAFAESKDQCIASGMDDFLTKPVMPEMLYATLLVWLKRRRD